MKNETFVKLAGIHCVLCGLLHPPMPYQFKWAELLAFIPAESRTYIGDSLHIMNWCMAVGWILLAYILIKFSKDMVRPGLGRTILASMVIFWIIRICILQPVYIGLNSAISMQMMGFFIVGLVLFIIPLVRSLKNVSV